MTAALMAEWTKLRSVRRWVLTLLGAAALIVGIGVLAASSGGTNVNEHPDFVTGPDGRPVSDEFEFVHRPLSGDGAITVRVASLRDDGVDAAAGVVLKDGLKPGSRYVSLFATPRTGVHLGHDFATDVPGKVAHPAPVWLRLARSGDMVTGDESADGTQWTRVAQVRAAGLPRDVLVGLFVASPPRVEIERRAGGTSVGLSPTTGRATFDAVTVTGATGQWSADTVAMGGSMVERGELGFQEQGGTFTVTGAGAVGPHLQPDDPVSIALFGILAGFMALVAVAALFVTAEYRRGMIRTTFAAEPRRGVVLAAKAIVVGVVSFLVALVGGAVALLAAQPRLVKHGFAPPGFPRYHIWDAPVLRALLLTAVFLALLAVFSAALGAVVRHSAAAITAVVSLVVLPVIVGSVVPLGAAKWVLHLTPAGGLATWRALPPTPVLADPTAAITPASGLAATAAYAAAALLLAWWLLRRRDA
ncbi:hypothetical protein [Dactylosporangium salmoneum]|uniref:ABC transporter permease n=1 Tax=Dactylosporangium salmoneum TaxID=53361 RepID=A0ABP5V9R5_9ACTN